MNQGTHSFQRPVLAPPGGEKRVMLHSCCAPCSGEVIEAMVASGLELEIFFYNPNIHPREEYELRKVENIRFAEEHGIPFTDADYDKDNWFSRVKGLEWAPERGERCTACFDMRFERTALARDDLLDPQLAQGRWRRADDRDFQARGVLRPAVLRLCLLASGHEQVASGQRPSQGRDRPGLLPQGRCPAGDRP